MRNIILIRTYKEEDKLFCKELLEDSVMNQLNHTFIGFLIGLNIMRIINVLSVVLMVILISTGLHIAYCGVLVFIPEIILYITLYVKFLYESRIVGNEVSEIPRIYTLDNFSRFWVAEAYEDFPLHDQEQDQQYVFMTEENLNDSNIDVSNHNKKIVGIMSFRKSNWQPTLGYIKRFYVQKKYTRKGIGNQLMNQAVFFADEHGILFIKAIVSEFEKHLINFYNSKNFTVNIIRDNSLLISITLYEYIFRSMDFHSD
ncbi:uncharacterized protein LOC118443644 isoform X9 [Vespa mandarinia]|uniref:uncharacterized protein LOC118443644 isoform X9 n=1 Tax=Vespa mandarinia TaxID=7446 RepID=UPI00161086FB|nr:uncharacterized protein LOC118443644 isoform X9 [Vespa mandarinia]